VLNTRVASVDERGLMLQPKAAAAEDYRLETDLVRVRVRVRVRVS